jgi:hypothetical protein
MMIMRQETGEREEGVDDVRKERRMEGRRTSTGGKLR